MDLAPQRRVRVAVLADVRLYRDGLALVLSQHDCISVVAQDRNDEEGVRALALLSPDVVLMDAAVVSTTTLVAQLIETLPQTRVVAYAVGADDYDAVRCAEAGVAGYVPRDGTTEELVTTVLGAVRGEFHCSPKVAALMLARLSALAREKKFEHRVPLTRRELEIGALLEHGLSNKEIAARLGIGQSTVKNHVHNLLEKLHARGRGQAAAQLRRGRVAI